MTAKPRHFLILDDEESIRLSIAAYMEDEGYVVSQARSGEEALEMIKETHIDGVLVDIRLPGIDGNAFMVEARKIIPEIKFVVHTGSADYILPDAVKALGVTPDKILVKPANDLGRLCDALKH